MGFELTTQAGFLLQRHGRLLAVPGFLSLLWVGFSLLGLGGHFELQAIRQNLSMHPMGGALLFVGLFAFGQWHLTESNFLICGLRADFAKPG